MSYICVSVNFFITVNKRSTVNNPSHSNPVLYQDTSKDKQFVLKFTYETIQKILRQHIFLINKKDNILIPFRILGKFPEGKSLLVVNF